MVSLLLAVLAAFPAPARAEKVVAVLSADHGVYRKTFDGFQAAFGSTVPVRLAAGAVDLDPDTAVVVAIGGRATLRSYPPEVAVIYCLAPVMPEGPRGRSTRVRIVPRPEDLVSRIKTAQPQARRLGVLWTQAHYQRYVTALAAAGKTRGLEVLSVPADAADLPRQLRLLHGRVDALWLAPDPLLVTPVNFRMITSFSRGAKIVFYAPTSELVQEGATASVAVTAEEMGRSAAQAAKRVLSGQPPLEETFGERVELVIDPARAAAAGLILSTDVVKAAGQAAPAP